jgi:Peptidase S46
MRRFNKKFITTWVFMCAILSASASFAFGYDEGMFAPDKVASLPLAKRGLKIKPTDIYNPATGGLSEAIIRLDTGCTGEFISATGLILTNHHCGFDALVSASSVGKDYGKDGYKADSIKDELPAKGYSISIPIRVEDVTAKITAGADNLTGEARDNAIKTNIASLEKAENEAATAKGNTVRVQAVSNGFFYYLYENKQIKDIRVVYAPSQMIGFYGGDPDNFEWTRHTGDFTFLRAYVAPDGTSAEYSQNNVPFERKRFCDGNGKSRRNDPISRKPICQLCGKS